MLGVMEMQLQLPSQLVNLIQRQCFLSRWQYSLPHCTADCFQPQSVSQFVSTVDKVTAAVSTCAPILTGNVVVVGLCESECEG